LIGRPTSSLVEGGTVDWIEVQYGPAHDENSQQECATSACSGWDVLFVQTKRAVVVEGQGRQGKHYSNVN
jgi:hypothetical protein